MYNSQITKERIKSLCRQQKIPMETMLIDCELGVNAIRQINNTKGMASFSLAKIADYLGCSVDYLLGRTTANVTVSDVHDSVGVVGQANAPVTINSGDSSKLGKLEQELLDKFSKLTVKQQIDVMNYIYDMEGNAK